MDIVFAVLDQRILELGEQTMEELGLTGTDDGFVFFWKLGRRNKEWI